mmetsp:Transcript_19407/g.21416  ORF Transcript_19407/g.21416 Transcript_19407/m.21416 type:complete len:82 (-) Transcript_19407:67-312(-)
MPKREHSAINSPNDDINGNNNDDDNDDDDGTKSEKEGKVTENDDVDVDVGDDVAKFIFLLSSESNLTPLGTFFSCLHKKLL